MKIFITVDDELVEIASDIELANRIVAKLKNEWRDSNHDIENLKKINTFSPSKRMQLLRRHMRRLLNVGSSYIAVETSHDRRKRLFRDTLVEKTLARIGENFDIVYTYRYEDYEYGTREGESHTTVKEMLFEIYDADKSYRRLSRKPSVLHEINKLQDVLQAYGDYECVGTDVFIGFIGTTKQYEKVMAERRRTELEQTAGQIAQHYNVSINSLEFLTALDEEIGKVRNDRDDWNNSERRMEEWAAVRYNGLGSDVYFDDLNYVNSQLSGLSDELFEVKEWVAKNCPLLFAQYTEQKLKAETQKYHEP